MTSVLLAEDDTSISEPLARALRREGYTVEVSPDGPQALERALITRVLQHTHGNQSHAAKILGITRGSLRNKIRLCGIAIEHVVSADHTDN